MDEELRRGGIVTVRCGGGWWVLCPSGSLDKTGMFFPAAAPGTDGIWSARLRGQSPCAVPEGHRTHQPPQATAPSDSCSQTSPDVQSNPSAQQDTLTT